MSHELGRSIAVHRGQFSAGMPWWYVGGVFVLASLVGIFQWLAGKGPATQAQVGVVGLLAGAGALLFAFMRWKQTLEIFEQGFAWKRLIGTQTVGREQIKKVSHVTHTSRRGTYVEVAIELVGGKDLSIVGIEQPAQAADLLAAPALGQPTGAAGGWQPPASAGSSSSTGWIPPGGAK